MTREELERAFKEQALLTRREAMADLRAKVDALTTVRIDGSTVVWVDHDAVLALIDGGSDG